MTSSGAEKLDPSNARCSGPYLHKHSPVVFAVSIIPLSAASSMISRAVRATFALQPRRSVHTAPALSTSQTGPKHTTDSYCKDVDPTPPDDSKIHRVDPSSESAQKPYEPPSGEWSRAGTKTTAYLSVSTTEPYAVPGEDKRYGGKETYAKEKGPETSKPSDGPEGKTSGGMKPDGK